MLFLIEAIDRAGAEEVRAAAAAEHREFVGGYLDTMLVGGPLMADDGSRAIGSMIVKDFVDRDAAMAFIEQEPYNRAGLFESVTIRAFHPVVVNPDLVPK